jgi:hypothetical protein
MALIWSGLRPYRPLGYLAPEEFEQLSTNGACRK